MITFNDITKFINYSRSTQIEPAPWHSQEGRWQVHKACHMVHTSKYPFNVLYFLSDATQDQISAALQTLSPELLETLQIVYPETTASNVKKVLESSRWKMIKHSWSIREFLLSFFKNELTVYLEKLRAGKPADYIDPRIETPSGFDRKIPNPLLTYLTDPPTTNIPSNGTLAIVLAEAGQGKTYMSRYLVGHLAESYSTVFPIFVDSSQWRGLTLDDQRSLYKTITHSFKHFGAAIPWVEGHEEEFLKITLGADLFRIVFDGFDEFVLRNRGEVHPVEVLDTLATLARETGSRIVITSRNSFWNTNMPDEAKQLVEQTHCFTYTIRAFDVNHAANYFRKNISSKQKQDRAIELFRHLASGSESLAGRGFVLSLLADLVNQDNDHELIPETGTGTLAWLLLKLCDRETLRQQLPFDGKTQLKIFKSFAKEVAEGAPTTSAFLRLCMQTVCETLHSKHIDQALEAFKSHPLLHKDSSQDSWSFSQEQIMIGLLALQLSEWNDMETKMFLEKNNLQPESIHDLGSQVVELQSSGVAENTRLDRTRTIIRKLAVGWEDHFQPGFVVPDGRRLAGIIALMSLDRLLSAGSSHTERGQMLLKLCGGHAISTIFLSGTISRFDFSGIRFESCLFDKVAWINCSFDEKTEFNSCKFHGGLPAERCTGLGVTKRIGCKLDPEAEAVFAVAEVDEGRRAYSESDLRSDMASLLGKFVIPGGIGLRTVAGKNMEKGTFGHCKFRREIIEVFKQLIIVEHHLSNHVGFNVRDSAEPAMKFYAGNNVFTGPLEEAFKRLAKKLVKK